MKSRYIIYSGASPVMAGNGQKMTFSTKKEAEKTAKALLGERSYIIVKRRY